MYAELPTHPIMLQLQLVILEHFRREDRHLDLLLESPGPDSERDRLWAVRSFSPWPPSDRPSSGLLIPLPPHRRLYLTHQGDIAQGRGRVVRRDAGHAVALLWKVCRVDLEVRTPRWRGRMRARRHGGRWVACWRPLFMDGQ